MSHTNSNVSNNRMRSETSQLKKFCTFIPSNINNVIKKLLSSISRSLCDGCRKWTSYSRSSRKGLMTWTVDRSGVDLIGPHLYLCIMVLITVWFYMKNFKILFVILLALEGATLGYNLFIILETIILYFHTIHSQSEGLKDVTMNCDYYERIFIIRITLLFISTVLIITFRWYLFNFLNIENVNQRLNLPLMRSI